MTPSLTATSMVWKMGTLGVLISEVSIPVPDLYSNQDKQAKYVCLVSLYGKTVNNQYHIHILS
jgi:hypothetical protein